MHYSYHPSHRGIKLKYLERERNVLFNDALNTFYLRLYGVRHMVNDHSDSEKGNPLSPHRLLLSINSKLYLWATSRTREYRSVDSRPFWDTAGRGRWACRCGGWSWPPPAPLPRCRPPCPPRQSRRSPPGSAAGSTWYLENTEIIIWHTQNNRSGT